MHLTTAIVLLVLVCQLFNEVLTVSLSVRRRQRSRGKLLKTTFTVQGNRGHVHKFSFRLLSQR